MLKNITITVSEETALWARQRAAEENTSVSKLVGRMLEEARLRTGAYQRDMKTGKSWQSQYRDSTPPSVFGATGCMNDGSPVFVDTSVLLYIFDQEVSKHVQALWDSGRGRVSWQVLNEFYDNATRKIGAPGGGGPRHDAFVYRMATFRFSMEARSARLALDGHRSSQVAGWLDFGCG